MYPSTLQPSVHHSFSPPLFSFFGTASQQQQLLQHHHQQLQQQQQQIQSAQLAPFQPQLAPLTSPLRQEPQSPHPPQPQTQQLQQQQQQQPQPQPQSGSKVQINDLLSPPVSPTRQVPFKKQLSLKYQAASAGSSMTVVIPSPPAVESAAPASTTRQPDTIEEEEAMVALQNISKQKTPPPAPIAISPSPSPVSPTGDSNRSAFSVVSSPNRSAASGVSGLVSVGASLSPSKLLEKSPGTPAPKKQRRLPTPKRLAYESPSDEPSELVIDQEDEESESEERPTNRRQGRKKAERGAPAKRRNSKTLLQEEAAFFSKKRKRDEDDDYEFDEDDSDDSDEEFQADDSEESDREFHIRTQKKSYTRRRTKVAEGEESGSLEPVASSPSKKGTNRGTQLGYLHNLGPELRSYLAAWLSRHTTVETGSPNSDPLYRCVKCTPPAGEQTKVSSSDRHKPGRVRIAIPQHLRKAHLPEKILAYHASSALFGQLPTASDLNNGLVASHRCGHSWCVAAHHLVWEPLGAKLARERGKQSCPGGDACRHGPLRCFKR